MSDSHDRDAVSKPQDWPLRPWLLSIVLTLAGLLVYLFSQDGEHVPWRMAITAFYVNLHVDDRPGVLAAVATVFAEHGVSIAGVRQEGAADEASLIVRTHRAREADLQATIADLRDSPAVRAIVGLMRVEGAD